MLSIFRTNQLLNGVLLLPYVILLHLSVFFVADAWTPENGGIFSNWVYTVLGDNNYILSNIIAIVLLWLQSFLINYISLEHRLLNDATLFPGLFYILLCSLLPDFLHLSPVLLGNTFFIIALSQILKSNKKTSVAGSIFNSGFWLGIASMFYFSFIYLIIWAVVGLSSLRAFKVTDLFQVLFGMLTSIFLVGTFFYWNGEFDIFWNKQFYTNMGFVSFKIENTPQFYTKIGIIFTLVFLMLLSFSQFVSKKIMQVRKKIITLYRALFVIAISLLFQANINIEHLLLFMVPCSYFVAIYFTNMKKNFAEVLHFILLTLVILFQFSSLIF